MSFVVTQEMLTAAVNAIMELNPDASKETIARAAFMAAALVPTPPPMQRDERQAAWSALRMVRDAVGELFGPVASIESEEGTLHRGPEFHHSAEAIIEALKRVATAYRPTDDETTTLIDRLRRSNADLTRQIQDVSAALADMRAKYPEDSGAKP